MAKERIIYDNYDVCTMFNDARAFLLEDHEEEEITDSMVWEEVSFQDSLDSLGVSKTNPTSTAFQLAPAVLLGDDGVCTLVPDTTHHGVARTSTLADVQCGSGDLDLVGSKLLGLLSIELIDVLGIDPAVDIGSAALNSDHMISCIELGKKAIRPENLANLCTCLTVTADYVLYGKRNQQQMDDTVSKLSSLTPEEYRVAQSMIELLHNGEKRT